MPRYVITHAKPLYDTFGYITISYNPLVYVNDTLDTKEFLSACAKTIMPRSYATVTPISPTQLRPNIFDMFFGVTNAVIVDHESLYPHILFYIDRTFPIVRDEMFEIVIKRMKTLLELKRTIPKNKDYCIVTPRCNSEFKLADVIIDNRNEKIDYEDLMRLEPLRSLEEAIEVAKTLPRGGSIFQLRDIIKSIMLMRIGLMKYYEYNIFTSILTLAYEISNTICSLAVENEFTLLKCYIDSYAIEGDKHDAKSLLTLEPFRDFPAKIEAEGTLYLYLPPLYAVVNGDTIVKSGLWVVWALEPEPKRIIDNVIIYGEYVHTPRIITNQYSRYDTTNLKLVIDTLLPRLHKRGRRITIEKTNTEMRMRPTENRYYNQRIPWSIMEK